MKIEIDGQKPLYEHNCNSCVYLGRNTYQLMSWMEKKAADVYYCVGTLNHVGKEACILVRWQKDYHGFGSFPYFVFYLLRYDPETEGNYALLRPYLWGLEQAKNQGLITEKK